MSIIAIIPARGGSKRFPRKNIYPLCGRPMLFYAIQACRASRHIDRVFVSTEDDEVRAIALECGAEVIDRPKELAGDEVWMQDVMRHAVLTLEQKGLCVDIVVRIQANSPMVEAEKIDDAIEKLQGQKQKLFEVFSVDQDGYEDAAIHVLQRDVVFQNALSVYKAVVTTDYVDVHTPQDLQEVEKRWGTVLRRKAAQNAVHPEA